MIKPTILCLAIIGLSACATTSDDTYNNQDPDSVGDVVMTPATDLNLKKVTIPSYLKSLENDYQMRAGGCSDIRAEIMKLDDLIGPDVSTDNMTEEEKNKMRAYRASSSVVGTIIPFRGVVREVSGASKQAKAIQGAYERGVARRAYLKGIAFERQCAM